VTNAEFLAFVNDGGYDRPELWLSDGWAARQAQGWEAPLYWAEQGGDWSMTTLAGPRCIRPDEPVFHFGYYFYCICRVCCSKRLGGKRLC
jgi:formylglycine-generating enzyme required for sulfatase activity